MKTSYRREMRRNYMIIDPENMKWSECEERMLSGNTIDGVLKLRVQQTEDGIRFYYDITSKQPLSRLFQAMRWKTEQILALLQGIFSALERLESYLVKESDIYLDPDYIYLSPENFRVWLCVVPGLGSDFRELFGRLLEKLLEHVDHEDKPSVILAYGIYQATRKEDYGVEDIRQAVHEERIKVRTAEHKEQEAPAGAEPDIGRLADFAGSRPAERTETVQQEKSRSFLEKLTGTLEHFLVGNRKNSCERAEEVRSYMFPQEMGDRPQAETPEEGSQEVRKSENAETEENGIRTENAERISAGPLYVLRGKDWETEDIPILYYPFVIGTQGNLVDYRLEHETVSKLHAKLDRRGGSFVIQDLNSTNGTMVNNRLLENNEEVEIHPGDEICIARFRFTIERKN